MQPFVTEGRGRVLTILRSILEQNDVIADVKPDSALVDIGPNSMGMVALMLRVGS